MQVGVAYVTLDGDSFRNQVSGRLLLGHRFSPTFAGDVDYAVASNNYFATVSPVQDRDGLNHGLGVTGFYRLNQDQPQPAIFRFGVRALANEAAGSDNSYVGGRFFSGLSWRLPMKVSADLSVAVTRFDFENDNSLNAFTAPRKDTLSEATLVLSRAFGRNINGFFRYRFNQNSSNIALFNYRRHVVSVGIGYRF